MAEHSGSVSICGISRKCSVAHDTSGILDCDFKLFFYYKPPALQVNYSHCLLLKSQVLQPYDLGFASFVTSTPISLWNTPHGCYLSANSTADQADTYVYWLLFWDWDPVALMASWLPKVHAPLSQLGVVDVKWLPD